MDSNRETTVDRLVLLNITADSLMDRYQVILFYILTALWTEPEKETVILTNDK